jgi:hypothetical protein
MVAGPPGVVDRVRVGQSMVVLPASPLHGAAGAGLERRVETRASLKGGRLLPLLDSWRPVVAVADMVCLAGIQAGASRARVPSSTGQGCPSPPQRSGHLDAAGQAQAARAMELTRSCRSREGSRTPAGH